MESTNLLAAVRLPIMKNCQEKVTTYERDNRTKYENAPVCIHVEFLKSGSMQKAKDTDVFLMACCVPHALEELEICIHEIRLKISEQKTLPL
jgi:hypothetical protein